MTPEMREALDAVGRPVSFADGEILREKGTFAPDMLLITQGQVDCVLAEGEAAALKVGPGMIVGEIGFLTGNAATATLRANGPVEALSLDAKALQRLRQDAPLVAAKVLSHLAELLQERTAQNAALLKDQDRQPEAVITIVRCSTLDQKRTAQRVRYDVECLEAGRTSEFADPTEGLITDDFDRLGTSFLAYTGVQAIGMMRVNLSDEGASVLRQIPELVDGQGQMIAVITAFAVRETYRDTDLPGQLLSAARTFAEASGAGSLAVLCPAQDRPVFDANEYHPITSQSKAGPTSMQLKLSSGHAGAD